MPWALSGWLGARGSAWWELRKWVQGGAGGRESRVRGSGR